MRLRAFGSGDLVQQMRVHVFELRQLVAAHHAADYGVLAVVIQQAQPAQQEVCIRLDQFGPLLLEGCHATSCSASAAASKARSWPARTAGSRLRQGRM